ncbi:MAG: hypothetical protein COA78_10300 [Blastopirellula sp.]|nr:MAG: hypothetical protein COA78_10300 [Blastopirellula sp.]
MATALNDEKSRLLLKATGKLDHGGSEVVKIDSSSYRILEQYFNRASGKLPAATADNQQPRTPLFADTEKMSPRRLLRRVTLSLAARLPTEDEYTSIDLADGPKSLDRVLDQVMQEDAFYDRLREGFNDIFLTQGYDGNAEIVLSYDHFNKTRLWYQKHDLSPIPEKDQQKARYKLAGDYRASIRREPLKLIEHIVRNDHPFTELVTADYIMVSPYSARGYGIYEKLKDQFKDANDPHEYIPTKLPALKARNGKTQKSETGFYPHSGMLSMFQYLRRYPTTETNRNRLRSRMYYQHFLGVDIMQLAPRVADAAAVDAKFDNPTMQAPGCVVCHTTLDPIAGLFQDYDKDGYLGPRKEGWYTDMFGSGFEGEDLPDQQQWRSLQWLGQRTANDPRFATAMVEHVYYILFGRKVLLPPEDIDDPMFNSKRRAYLEQRSLISQVAQQFKQNDFNLKVAFKKLIASDLYQIDGLALASQDPSRLTELDDLGLVRLLTPEQLERKIEAVFGKQWGRLIGRESKLHILYGGIDSKSVTERALDPSGAMGAIQRMMSNDVACHNVALDFTRDPSQRLLFPKIEIDVIPAASPEADQKIQQAVVHLHKIILGRDHSIDHPEVIRTHQLFADIVKDAKAAEGIDKRGSYSCDRVNDVRLDDPDYTLRAWRGVVTYLLRQHDFLYE